KVSRTTTVAIDNNSQVYVKVAFGKIDRARFHIGFLQKTYSFAGESQGLAMFVCFVDKMEHVALFDKCFHMLTSRNEYGVIHHRCSSDMAFVCFKGIPVVASDLSMKF